MSKKKVKIVMTGADAVVMKKSLEEMGAITGIPAFSIAVARNLSIVTPKVEELEAGLALTPEYKEYEKDQRAVFDSVATPNQIGQLSVSTEAWPAYRDNMEELKIKHAAAIAAREKQKEDYATILEERLDEMEMYVISEDDIHESISGITLSRVIKLIQ